MLLIDHEGKNRGVMPLRTALALARELGLDLVEVDPSASPPVCRILDYGKWKYQQEKKEREARKHRHAGELHEVRLRPNIGEHDLTFKVRNMERLLLDGAKVRVAVRFRRGREMEHTDRGYALLERVKALLDRVGIVEKPPTMEGQFLSMIVSPDKRGIAQRQRQAKEAKKSIV